MFSGWVGHVSSILLGQDAFVNERAICQGKYLPSDYRENVSVRILEPRRFEPGGNVNIALAGEPREIIMLEAHPFLSQAPVAL